ncbi:uncharacterized protein EAE98_005931 [Botrytis deweyae]|uniref:Uncharacterized protein n=1 Tax=Botrytis deweyae TaxID=2478750 RepID=A0ABQ7IL68_9HELO|nr:uncharacterized protein EAE98_005931 [Botrytis deweyae]KAF7927549.1 hypothetical protein EAE98_005931 [Botrytis deweyae]
MLGLLRGRDTDQNRNRWSKDEIRRRRRDTDYKGCGCLRHLCNSNIQVIEIYSIYQVIDTKKVPGFFSRYPATISVSTTDVKSTLSAIAQEASQSNSRERRRALIRYSNAYGDSFSIYYCSTEVERLVLLASIIEVIVVSWDYILSNKPSDFTLKNIRQSALATVLRKAIDLDSEKAPRIIETL